MVLWRPYWLLFEQPYWILNNSFIAGLFHWSWYLNIYNQYYLVAILDFEIVLLIWSDSTDEIKQYAKFEYFFVANNGYNWHMSENAIFYWIGGNRLGFGGHLGHVQVNHYWYCISRRIKYICTPFESVLWTIVCVMLINVKT